MNPFCGHCHVMMTPENSRLRPELFLCDACAVNSDFVPSARANRVVRKIEWVPVSEALPGTDVTVLISTPVGLGTAFLTYGFWVWTGDDIRAHDVTHWAELPSPPNA